MKQKLKPLALTIIVIYAALVLTTIRVVWTEPAVVLERIPTQDKYGDIKKYVLIVRYQDGLISEQVVSVSTYASCKVGDIYYFNRDSTSWGNINFALIKF